MLLNTTGKVVGHSNVFKVRFLGAHNENNCVEQYISWFDRKSFCPFLFTSGKALDYLKFALNKDEANSTWLDGFNDKITVRQAAIHPVYELNQKACETFPKPTRTQQDYAFQLLAHFAC